MTDTNGPVPFLSARIWNGANGQVLRTIDPPKPEAANQQAKAK
jgi:hypothetical protein